MDETTEKLAREAGLNEGEISYFRDDLARLVALARADERERCARVCEQHGTGGFSYAAALRSGEKTNGSGG